MEHLRAIQRLLQQIYEIYYLLTSCLAVAAHGAKQISVAGR